MFEYISGDLYFGYTSCGCDMVCEFCNSPLTEENFEKKFFTNSPIDQFMKYHINTKKIKANTILFKIHLKLIILFFFF